MLFSKNYSSYSKDINFKKYNLLTLNYKLVNVKKNNQIIKEFNKYTYFKIFFIKKERLYTKLKYSRVPQFDLTSGAVASLVTALFGFMVTEKFGFELIDSGDFYTIVMYLIFIGLIVKTVINLFDNETNQFKLFSINNIFNFYKTIFVVFINYIKKYLF